MCCSSGDRKPKIDLLRTCIAALPRLLPLGTSQEELIEMLARLTIHMDQELAVQAFQSLQYFVIELPEWRKSVFRGQLSFARRRRTTGFRSTRLHQFHHSRSHRSTDVSIRCGQNDARSLHALSSATLTTMETCGDQFHGESQSSLAIGVCLIVRSVCLSVILLADCRDEWQR